MKFNTFSLKNDFVLCSELDLFSRTTEHKHILRTFMSKYIKKIYKRHIGVIRALHFNQAFQIHEGKD